MDDFVPFYSLSKRPPPERKFVEDDQPCVQCGYNLRGVILSGNCPECGKAVTLSLRGEGTLRERTMEILDWQERGGRHIFGD